MKCLKDQCRSPVACNGFGYCRELNFDGGASYLADAALDEIERLQDLARNVAGLDLDALERMSRNAMRATILEYREQAQGILNRSRP